MIGTLNDFKTKDLRLSGLKNSKVEGDISFKNLLNDKEIIIDGNYKDVISSHDDLKELMPEILSALPKELTKLEEISFKGENRVTITDITTKGTFITALGDAEVDLTLSNYLDTEEATYKGQVALEAFDLL